MGNQKFFCVLLCRLCHDTFLLPAKDHRKHNIFLNGQTVHQIKILKYKADLLSSYIRQPVSVDFADIFFHKPYRPAGLLVDHSEDL